MRPASARNSGARPARRWSAAWHWIDRAGSVLTVVGGVLSVLAGVPPLAVLLLAIAAGLIGDGLRRRGRKVLGVSLSVVASGVVVAALIAITTRTLTPAPSASGDLTVVGPTSAVTRSTEPPSPDSAIPGRTSRGPAPPTGETQVLFDGAITLVRQAGADVDGREASTITDQAGAVGATDLFHDSGRLTSDVIRTHGGVYMYPTGLRFEVAYDTCAEYTGPNPPYTAHNPTADITVDTSFCFVTSDHRLAWATIESVRTGSMVAVLAVKVWEHRVGQD